MARLAIWFVVLIALGIAVWVARGGAPEVLVGTDVALATNASDSPSGVVMPKPAEQPAMPVPHPSSPEDEPRDGPIGAVQQSATPVAPALVRRPPTVLTDSREWRDGQVTRTVWIDPRVVIEFSPRNGEDNKPIAPISGAQLIENERHRSWLLPEHGESSVTLTQRLGREGALAPAMRTGPDASAPVKALTGRVFVRLDPKWSKAKVERWAARQQLTEIALLRLGPGWWSAYATVGSEMFGVAQRLRALDDVQEARLDWWRPLVQK